MLITAIAPVTSGSALFLQTFFVNIADQVESGQHHTKVSKPA
jgi:hypothetical protein